MAECKWPSDCDSCWLGDWDGGGDCDRDRAEFRAREYFWNCEESLDRMGKGQFLWPELRGVVASFVESFCRVGGTDVGSELQQPFTSPME